MTLNIQNPFKKEHPSAFDNIYNIVGVIDWTATHARLGNPLSKPFELFHTESDTLPPLIRRWDIRGGRKRIWPKVTFKQFMNSKAGKVVTLDNLYCCRTPRSIKFPWLNLLMLVVRLLGRTLNKCIGNKHLWMFRQYHLSTILFFLALFYCLPEISYAPSYLSLIWTWGNRKGRTTRAIDAVRDGNRWNRRGHAR